MGVLVVAGDRGRRAQLLAALAGAGLAAEGCAPLRVTAAVAELRPAALVLDVGAAEPTRRALARAREAAGAPLPAALLLPARSSWLRAPLPPELLPAAVLPASALLRAGGGPRLAEALRRLLGDVGGPMGGSSGAPGAAGDGATALRVETAAGALCYDPTSHELDVLPRKVVHRREAGTAPPTPPCGRR